MPNVSTDVDTFLRSADKAAMGTNIGATALTGATAFSNGLHVHFGNVNGVALGVMTGITAAAKGDDAVRIGFSAATNCASANAQGVFIGRHAGNSSTGGNQVCIGHAAGQYGYSCNASVLIGYEAGRNANNTIGSNGFSSVAIGHLAARVATSFQTGTMIGAGAGAASTNLVGAVIVGYNAGYNSTTATNATIVGNEAGLSATTTTEATILGNYAGYGATTATRAVLIGHRAGFGLTAATSRLIIESNPTYSNTGLIAGNFATAERSVELNCLKLGMYSATPVTKQSITGSRGGNAALADLLTKLALVGIITDSTSA
jgi:hypothetical protein